MMTKQKTSFFLVLQNPERFEVIITFLLPLSRKEKSDQVESAKSLYSNKTNRKKQLNTIKNSLSSCNNCNNHLAC